MTDTQIFTDLANGVYDDQLDALARAVKARRQYVNESTLVPGTRVAISDGIKPRYLTGVTGAVSSRPPRRAGDVQVDIDEEFRIRVARFGTCVGVPANCLRKIT